MSTWTWGVSVPEEGHVHVDMGVCRSGEQACPRGHGVLPSWKRGIFGRAWGFRKGMQHRRVSSLPFRLRNIKCLTFTVRVKLALPVDTKFSAEYKPVAFNFN